jgi:hypothetical protein
MQVGSTPPNQPMTAFYWAPQCFNLMKGFGGLGATEMSFVHVAGSTQEMLDL